MTRQAIKQIAIIGVVLGALLFASNWMYSTSVTQDMKEWFKSNESALEGYGLTVSYGDLDYDFMRNRLRMTDLHVSLAPYDIHAEVFEYRGDIENIIQLIDARDLSLFDDQFRTTASDLKVSILNYGVRTDVEIGHVHASGHNAADFMSGNAYNETYTPFEFSFEMRHVKSHTLNTLLPESILTRVLKINHWKQQFDMGSQSSTHTLDIEGFKFTTHLSDSEDSTYIAFDQHDAYAHYDDSQFIGTLPFHSLNEALFIFPHVDFPTNGSHEKTMSLQNLHFDVPPSEEDDHLFFYFTNGIEHLDVESHHVFQDSTFQVTSTFSEPTLGNYQLAFKAYRPEDGWAIFPTDAFQDRLNYQLNGSNISSEVKRRLELIPLNWEWTQDSISFSGDIGWGTYGEIYWALRGSSSIQ